MKIFNNIIKSCRINADFKLAQAALRRAEESINNLSLVIPINTNDSFVKINLMENKKAS